MERFSLLSPEERLQRLEKPDTIRVARWFACYALLLAACCSAVAVLGHQTQWNWRDLFAEWGVHKWTQRWQAFQEGIRAAPPAIKLGVFAMYLTLCTTFCPLPTRWLVAAVATPAIAVGSGLWDTVLLVSLVGAAGSTVANLNDYHLFTWILRSRHVASVRHTRLHRLAARWFGSHPFFILVIFNILPIPIDVARMLAATDRYGRLPFAAANFVGRALSYGFIAYVIYRWDLSWAPWALLAFGVVVALGGAAVHAMKKLAGRRDKPSSPTTV